jgi:DNA polymerase III delta prime subunit
MISKTLKAIRNMSWEEKYRPQLIRQIIMPARIKTLIESYVESNSITNMIFYSGPGTGKTTTVQCISHDLGAEFLSLNTGEENKASVQGIIANFASTMSLEGKPKIILLDEADTEGAVPMLNTLRGAIERTSSTTKYFFTCNDLSKIPDAIKSRCDVIDFSYKEHEFEELFPQMVKRLMVIAQNEVDTEVGHKIDAQYIESIVRDNYPDMRHMIKSLQFSYRSNGGSIVPLKSQYAGTTEKAYEAIFGHLCQGNLHEARAILAGEVVDTRSFHSRFAEYVFSKTDKKQSVGIAVAFATSARWESMSVPSDLNVGMGLFADLIKIVGPK